MSHLLVQLPMKLDVLLSQYRMEFPSTPINKNPYWFLSLTLYPLDFFSFNAVGLGVFYYPSVKLTPFEEKNMKALHLDFIRGY